MTYQIDTPKDFALPITGHIVHMKGAPTMLADKPEPILTPERKDGVFKAYKELRAVEWNEEEFGVDAQAEELVHLVFQAILEQDSSSSTSVIAERINDLLQSMESPRLSSWPCCAAASLLTSWMRCLSRLVIASARRSPT